MQAKKNYISESFFWTRELASAGFALPLDSFITCPISQPTTFVFPDLKSATAFGFAEITLSTIASIAPM